MLERQDVYKHNKRIIQETKIAECNKLMLNMTAVIYASSQNNHEVFSDIDFIHFKCTN